MSTAKKVGIGVAAVAGAGAIAGIIAGIVTSTTNGGGQSSGSNGTKGPTVVPTPQTPTNTNKVVSSGLGNQYTDTKA